MINPNFLYHKVKLHTITPLYRVRYEIPDSYKLVRLNPKWKHSYYGFVLVGWYCKTCNEKIYVVG